MPKLTAQDRSILAALEIFDSAGDVAAETGAPFHRVIHLQRLFGPVSCQRQRVEEAHRTHEERVEITAKRNRPEGPCPLYEKLGSIYGRYWTDLEAGQAPLPKPRLRRVARMVPDDRAEEGLTFDQVMHSTVAAIQRAGSEGRGAA